MRLNRLIKSLDTKYHFVNSSSSEDFEVEGISCNSKEVKDNFLFVAIKGTDRDGHDFIAEAIDKGARVIILQSREYRVESRERITFIRVEDTRKALAKLAAQFYGYPCRKIKVVGVTGTNGKTTVSYLIEAILKEAGLNPAVIGTVNHRFQNEIIPSRNTTPGALELESMLVRMLNAGVNYAVVEVSSHALDQERTAGINFHSAIFTNLTSDHLDYHFTTENYFQAKTKLFKDINSHAFTVINNDDMYGQHIINLTPAQTITYAIVKPAQVVAKDIKLNITHTEFCLNSKRKEADPALLQKGRVNFHVSLIGKHNVYNILAAIAWALKEGLDLETIKTALEKFYLIPGRLERIYSGDFLVFVDYAHTEDALANAVRTLRQLSKNKLIVVFGCGGERDKTKRPKMGKIVSEIADHAIITSDNPRSEDPEAIIEEIKEGIEKDNYKVIPEREEAIRESLRLAKPGDVVLVAGKGHENYQILKDRRIHFDDREVVRQCLKLMNY